MAPAPTNGSIAGRKPPMPARRVGNVADTQDSAPTKASSAAHPGPGFVRERKNSIGGSSAAESVGPQGSTTSTKSLRSSFLQEKIDFVCRGCHELLLATAPASLGSLEDEKAFYQKAVVKMFREVFDKAEMGLTRRVEEALFTVDAAEKEQEVRDEARAAAELELQQKRVEIEAKNEALNQDTAALQETDASLQVAIERKNKAQAQHSSLIAEREGTVAAQKESLEVLKEGTWTSAREHKKHVGVLVGLFKKLNADASLISALPSALEKKPADRGTFDGMVVAQLEEILAKHVVSVQDEVARASSALHHASSGADAAIALAEAAREKHRKSSEIAAQSQAEWKAFELNLRNAIWAAKEQQRALKQTAVDLLDEQAGLERIRGAKATLSHLNGGCTEPLAESLDPQGASEEPGSVKMDFKGHSFSPSAREKAVASSAPQTREKTTASPALAVASPTSDDRRVAGKAVVRSASKPASPDRTAPGSRPESQPGSPGQGSFAGA